METKQQVGRVNHTNTHIAIICVHRGGLLSARRAPAFTHLSSLGLGLYSNRRLHCHCSTAMQSSCDPRPANATEVKPTVKPIAHMRLGLQSLATRQTAKLEQWLPVQADRVESLNLDAMDELSGAIAKGDLDKLAADAEEVRKKHAEVSAWLAEKSKEWAKLAFESQEEYEDVVKTVNNEALTFTKKSSWNEQVKNFFDAFTALQQKVRGLLRAKTAADKAVLDATAKRSLGGCSSVANTATVQIADVVTKLMNYASTRVSEASQELSLGVEETLPADMDLQKAFF